MKSPVCILTLVILFLALFSCNNPSHTNSSMEETEMISKKEAPFDHESLKLFGPEPTKKDIVAYYNSMESERVESLTRSDFFDGEWTLQGPTNIGGRVNSIAVDPNSDDIIFAGFARGGLWKTTDGGENWVPLWNDQSAQAVSAIAIDPNDSDIIYAGSGDINISGSVFLGDGLYKSIDGGMSWEHIGLDNTYIIGDILINPDNTQQITVATMGIPFEETQERGVYYTEDGGTTWTNTLFIDSRTGIHDLAFHPSNPEIMLAGAWTRFRNGKESVISGEGSGVYRSINNGESWSIVEFEVPDTMGRTSVCFSETNPDLAYVMFIDQSSVFHSLHRSMDGGSTWELVAEQDEFTPSMMGGFAWFFGRIASIIDPTDNIEKPYILGVDLWAFDDEEGFVRKSPPWWWYEVHADKHAILTDGAGNILLGTDGGLYRFDQELLIWEDIENIPNNMFYRVAYNPHNPTLYYGGMQDNGSTGGNIDQINEWQRIYGGDGFQMAFHPTDSDIVFVETQNGRVYSSLDGGWTFDYIPEDTTSSDRRNWDMQYIISPHNPDILYSGTFRATKFVSDGFGFYDITPISESLTDEKEFINSYHTITSLDESILEEGLLYYGTADGNVWVRDNDEFKSISDGLPKHYVTSIKASPSDVDRVFVTLSNYKFNDHSARIYRSDDRGTTWTAIGNGLPDGAVNDVIIYDEYLDSLLFAATNVGVFATIDAGQNWHRLGENLPLLPVNDLVFNVENKEIVAGTYGRSVNTYPLDSVINEFNKIVIVDEVKMDLLISVSVYPNPVSNILHINSPKAINIEVIDSKGTEITKIADVKEKTIDVSSYTAGIYFVRLINTESGRMSVREVIVQ